jgi:hypothetical protein
LVEIAAAHAICGALVRLRGDEEAAVCACELLAALPLGGQEEQAQVAQWGALEAVLGALNGFPENSSVTSHALLVLAKVCRGHPAMQDKAARIGACEGVLGSLERHRTDRDVQR